MQTNMLDTTWEEFIAWVEQVMPDVFTLYPEEDSPILRQAVLDKISDISGKFYNSKTVH